MDYDVIIIGSGFGGAIPAYHLSLAGLKVCVLERGPWRDTPAAKPHIAAQERCSFPQGWGLFRRGLRHYHHRFLPAGGLRLSNKGLFEVFAGPEMDVLCSSSVGGGSHVYGGILSRPAAADYWDNVSAGLDSQAMEHHYEAVLKQMKASPAPVYQDVSDYGVSVPEGGGQTPVYWAYGDKDSMHDIDYSKESMFGSPGGVKTSLDGAYLIPALKLGAQIRALTEAESVTRIAGGYRVAIRDRYAKNTVLSAPKVIVAAGCINSMILLSRSIEQGGLAAMPALGQGFSGNGDMLAYWRVADKERNHCQYGPYQRLLAAYPGQLVLQAGVAGLSNLPLPKWLSNRLKNNLFLAAMAEGDSGGSLCYERQRLSISYSLEHNTAIQQIRDTFARIENESQKPVMVSKRMSTVHPLGGARVGRNKLQAVVQSCGQVFDHEELYITDASALPGAPGMPPSLSVAAWAKHVAEQIIKKLG
jgi:cholesterol oxidase